MRMPTHERRYFIDELIGEVEKRNEAYKKQK